MPIIPGGGIEVTGDALGIQVLTNDSKTVKPSGGDYTTIQGAIDNYAGQVVIATATITPDAGTYAENLVISTPYIAGEGSLVIQGDSRTAAGKGYNVTTIARAGTQITYTVDAIDTPGDWDNTDYVYLWGMASPEQLLNATPGATSCVVASGGYREFETAAAGGLDNAGLNGRARVILKNAPDLSVIGIGMMCCVTGSTTFTGTYKIIDIDDGADTITLDTVVAVGADINDNEVTIVPGAVVFIPNVIVDRSGAAEGKCLEITSTNNLIFDGIHFKGNDDTDDWEEGSFCAHLKSNCGNIAFTNCLFTGGNKGVRGSYLCDFTLNDCSICDIDAGSGGTRIGVDADDLTKCIITDCYFGSLTRTAMASTRLSAISSYTTYVDGFQRAMRASNASTGYISGGGFFCNAGASTEAVVQSSTNSYIYLAAVDVSGDGDGVYSGYNSLVRVIANCTGNNVRHSINCEIWGRAETQGHSIFGSTGAVVDNVDADSATSGSSAQGSII